MELNQILDAFSSGKPIIVFDDEKREGEADIFIHASKCTPQMVRMLRKDGGGMICIATSSEIASKLRISFYVEMVRKCNEAGLQKLAIDKTPYGDEPSFSVYINSRKCYTGISDDDRSMTIREFAEIVSGNKEEENNLQDEFVKKFYAPGHVPLLISRGIENRKGHTEFAIEIARKAGMSAAVVICEMLGNDGKALSWEGAKGYAKKNGYLAIKGKELLEFVQ
ncbi:MAG: 3,4-dihydroxy-2-butanone-4-phosphate synthase [Candidatus Micrarchaeota archaeon]